MLGLDSDNVLGHLDNAAGADQFIGIQFVDAAGAVDEMVGGVDVRSGMDAERDLRNIGRVATRHRFCGRHADRRVSSVDRNHFAHGNWYVMDLHFKTVYFSTVNLSFTIGFAATTFPLAIQRGFSSVPRFKYFWVKNTGSIPGLAVIL